MALKILQPGIQPLGQFDLLDSDAELLGGEIMVLQSLALTVGDKAAFDSFDGYVNSLKRVVASRYNRADGYGPFMLADEGTTHYGTLFGSVVGSTAGCVVAGTVIGPVTNKGSGKVTLWDKPGLYAVSLDAVDTASLVPTNASLSYGTALTYCPTTTPTPANYGKLTAVGSTAANGNTSVVGHFVSFETSASLVNTPNHLVSALGTKSYEYMVFHFQQKTF